MSSYKTEVKDLHYNAATRSFEAMVVMYEGSEAVKYPTSLGLPIDSDFSTVSKKLVAQAKTQRARRAGYLVSRTPKGDGKLAHLGDLARRLSDTFGYSSGQRAA